MAPQGAGGRVVEWSHTRARRSCDSSLKMRVYEQLWGTEPCFVP